MHRAAIHKWDLPLLIFIVLDVIDLASARWYNTITWQQIVFVNGAIVTHRKWAIFEKRVYGPPGTEKKLVTASY